MGIRFRKSIKIANGIKLNVSKSGVSLSLGKKGLHYSINSKGTSTATASLPGTGLSYQKKFNTFGGLKKMFEGDEKKTKYIEKTNEIVPVNNELEDKYNDYQEYIKDIKSFHKQVSETIDWNTLAQGLVPIDANEEEKANWGNSIELANRVLEKDEDAYLEVMEKYSPMDAISVFGSDFEFGIKNNVLVCRFNVKINDVVPHEGFKKSESTNKISECEIKGSQFNDLAQDYVCSCAIRIAREAFALLPVDMVIINAEDLIFDSSTGNNRDATILSVLFIKDGFDNINFEMIDPSDFVSRFKSNVSFSKTNGFKEVSDIELPKL